MAVVLAESKEDLEELLQEINQILQNANNMRIDRKKTNVTVLARNNKKANNIILGGEKLK